MRKIIHHLRRQPEEVRRDVLHISIFVVSIIVVFLWVLSLGKSFTNPEAKIKIEQDLQPFSVLKNSVIGGYDGSKNVDSSVSE